jgi:hypothetical protein
MINISDNNVPDKQIVVFDDGKAHLSNDRVSWMLSKPEVRRDWFTTHFYRCLPLIIGNQYGFILKSEYSFSAEWNGGPKASDTYISTIDITLAESKNLYPNISSHFGHGIITVNPPFVLRTPNGVNLMTINPPNYVLPNITVMTGVVEADNLRRNFTFNLKLQMPNIKVFFPKGTPLVGVIPIPRYFSDSFDLEFAENVFSDKDIFEETQSALDANTKRDVTDKELNKNIGRDYYQGKDVYGNLFPDHQKP